jgi:2-polyprenyl-6-methoxyphenol hydroxylase-like FAD-dependent oxidoreductase
MKNERVLISGASVAGPALAFWLAKFGWDVTVVERAPGIRPGGYAIDFRGSGYRVLERMGLLDAVKAHETRNGSITMVDENNKVIARLPDGFTSGELEILRGDLANLLYETTHNEAIYIFDDSIHSIVQKVDGVEVTFHNGKKDNFDIVVGADGLHSNVRAVAFGEESTFVEPMGYYIAIFTVPDFLHLGDTGRYYAQLGKRVGCFGSKNDGMAKASFHFASPRLDYDRRDVAAQKALIRETFADMRWEAPRMLEMMDGATDFYFDSLSQVKMNPWSNGRVVLLGDACSCASPMSGMGTSIAMVGAYLLAYELRACGGDYTSAFAKYERAMREFVSEAQKMAEGVSWFIPQTKLKLWFSIKFWSWMPQSTLRKLMIEQPARIANLVDLTKYEL